jgi:sulfur carrier protein
MYNAGTFEPSAQPMNILLNGKTRCIDNETHLNQLIEQLSLTGKRLAVEINREIIPKSAHEQYKIQAGDNIEIIHAIGGG